MSNCNEKNWIDHNKDFYNWYYDNYPFLKQFKLPLSFDDLKDFYKEDMSKRNLPTQDGFLNCYDAVFSYFIENYPRQDDPTRFRGKTFVERTLENLPGAVTKTFSDISGGIGKSVKSFLNNVGIPPTFLIIIAGVGLFLLIKIK